MTTFIGTPNMLVTLNPPIGTIKRVRFDSNGEFTTENDRMINRFYHRFDSKPSESGIEQAIEEVDDGSQDEPNKTETFNCKKCDFTTDNKGLLMAHYREHKKEEVA